MNILIIGAVFAVILLFVPRLLGRSKEAMLDQYHVFEKRFWFQLKVYPSKWGKGIGERYTLYGDYHGFPVTLYDHFHGSGRKKERWTSLSLEMLFAGELEIVLESRNGDVAARFSRSESVVDIGCQAGEFAVFSDSEAIGKSLLDGETGDRIAQFGSPGSFRLSKGFFEYRESGLMLDEKMRIRFQAALGILADLGDRLAELVGKPDSVDLREDPT